MTGERVARWLSAALASVGRRLPAERGQWVEAMLAESQSVPEGWRRTGWVAGAVPVLIAEVVSMGASSTGGTVRWATVGAVAAVGGLLVPVFVRYPQVGQGAGTPLYLGVTAVLLAGYLAATFALTRRAPGVARDAAVAGLAAAALWTLGTPAGGRYHLQGSIGVLYGIGLAVAFAGPPILAAARRARRGATLERGVLTGAATGMYAALANLIGGLILVLALPGRVPMDDDVLARHHTPADILGANVGEDLVVYVFLLIAWPVAAAFLGMLASAVAGSTRRQQLST
jgi:hypothetical protein